MRPLDNFINEHYINSDYDLERFIENFYENKEDVNKLKSVLISQINESNEKSFTKHVDHVVLIGEMRFKSLRKVAKILDYADPTKLTYELKNGKIYVDDGEYKFVLEEHDKYNTIVIVRSGYSCPNVQFLISQIIEMGFTVMNDPTYVSISSNKYLLGMLLQKNNIPQPKFVLTSLKDINKGDDKKLEEKLKSLYKDKLTDDTKFVCKILNGHGGKGVFICTKSNITSILQTFFAIDEECQILVQEYCEIEGGDIRVNVITLNGKQQILSTVMRNKSGEDFRTNLSLGNTITPNIKITPEQRKLALDVAKASGLIWCGVDLMPLKNGKTYVVEYNGAPGTMSENLSQEELEKANEMFYTTLLETINKLC